VVANFFQNRRFWFALIAGFGLLCVYGFLQLVGMTLALWLAPHLGIVPQQPYETNGFLMTVGTLASTGGGLLVLVSFARLQGFSLREFFGGFSLPPKATFFWFIVLVVFNFIWLFVSDALGENPADEFLTTSYKTAEIVPLYWFTLTIMAPLFEEAFFRGFLFEGLRTSRLGAWGAMIATSLFWMMVHIQYDWYGLLTIAVLGLIIGTARLKTGSVAVSVVLHVTNNFMAMASLYWIV
jgi:membrane protease YdiL (CAAX protease family)